MISSIVSIVLVSVSHYSKDRTCFYVKSNIYQVGSKGTFDFDEAVNAIDIQTYENAIAKLSEVLPEGDDRLTITNLSTNTKIYKTSKNLKTVMTVDFYSTNKEGMKEILQELSNQIAETVNTKMSLHLTTNTFEQIYIKNSDDSLTYTSFGFVGLTVALFVSLVASETIFQIKERKS